MGIEGKDRLSFLPAALSFPFCGLELPGSHAECRAPATQTAIHPHFTLSPLLDVVWMARGAERRTWECGSWISMIMERGTLILRPCISR